MQPTGMSPTSTPPRKRYTFIDLFAGIGGFRFGFEPKGGACVWSCEINPHSRKTYSHNHDTPYGDIFPDVREAGPDDVPDHDVLIAGFACFATNTMILTDQGYTPIQEVLPGTMVLTHKGRWRPVTHVSKRDDVPSRTIRAQGVPDMVTTDEHPLYTRRRQATHHRSDRNYHRSMAPPTWTKAKDTDKSHYLGQVLPTPSDDGFTPAFWWLIGRYLADGSRIPRHKTGAGHPTKGTTGRIEIACPPHKTQELTERIKSAGYHATLYALPGIHKHIITNSHLYQWTQQFGKYSHGKKLPRIAIELNQDKAKALLEGYLSGDGHREEGPNGPNWTANSTSKALALGMALIAQRAHGIVASLTRWDRPPETTIEGRVVNQRTAWRLRIPILNRSASVEGNYGWKLVRHNDPNNRTETVWNLTVSQDNSYVADGAIVHNCEPFSKAGVSKNNSMGRPHGFADETRGTLFFQIVRILASHRPQAFLLENVPHILHHDQGRTYATVKFLLEQELGYHISHRIIDARPYVPQHRRRIFISGHAQKDRPTLSDLRLPGEDQGPALRDILHPQDGTENPEHPYTEGPLAAISGKYTLGQGTWQTLIKHRAKHRDAGNGFGYSIADLDQPTRTLTARYGKDGQEILISQDHTPLPRRLTPRECSRLMGMPDLVIPVSDSQAYRQLGHSVVPPLVEDLADFIMA